MSFVLGASVPLRWPRETLKNDPISLFPPLESVIFDLAARFNPFLGSFWVF